MKQAFRQGFIQSFQNAPLIEKIGEIAMIKVMRWQDKTNYLSFLKRTRAKSTW
jgi:hypothetical protein